MSEKCSRTRFGNITLSLALTLGCAPVFAQGGPAMPKPVVDPHDISGYWEIQPNGRSIPPAELVKSVTPAKLKAVSEEDQIDARWCRPIGMPQQMDSPRPISITQGSREMIMSFEANTLPRYVFFKDKHTDPAIFDPSSTGESIAHWEGDTLVVDTIGFHETKGRMMIPGGGFRTEKSHVVERFKLLNNDVLELTSTWTDPDVFATPHTYVYRYSRPQGTYIARPGVACDPWDKDQAAFVMRTFTPEMKKKAEEQGAAQELLAIRPAGQ